MIRNSILILQHLNVEHPGIFRSFLQRDSFNIHTIELDQGERIPNLRNYDALWVMGGPMDVWEKEKYPWLIDEISTIREAIIDLTIPFMGICLGHQLLASAFGAEVGPCGKAEVGILPVKKTLAGSESPFLLGLPNTMETLQWHSAEVKTIPNGFSVLAESENCSIQSLALEKKAFSVQYHQEITKATISDWSKVPEYKKSLEDSLGKDAVKKLEEDVLKKIDNFNYCAELLYKNWKSTVFAS